VGGRWESTRVPQFIWFALTACVTLLSPPFLLGALPHWFRLNGCWREVGGLELPQLDQPMRSGALAGESSISTCWRLLVGSQGGSPVHVELAALRGQHRKLSLRRAGRTKRLWVTGSTKWAVNSKIEKRSRYVFNSGCARELENTRNSRGEYHAGAVATNFRHQLSSARGQEKPKRDQGQSVSSLGNRAGHPAPAGQTNGPPPLRFSTNRQGCANCFLCAQPTIAPSRSFAVDVSPIELNIFDMVVRPHGQLNFPA